MNINNTSQLILKIKNVFKKKKILFSGNIQDSLPEILKTKLSYIHLQKYNFLKYFSKIKKNKIFINFLVNKNMLKNCNTVIYFFSKNKKETFFQLKKIISLLKKNKKIFLVGENRSGINSFVKYIKNEIYFKKLTYGRKCVIYCHVINKKISFKLKEFYKIHYWKKIPIIFLPGMFGYKKLDLGSKFLISTFYKNKLFNKKILDIGAGSGLLSIAILKIMKKNKITIAESCLTSIQCCKKTFKLNNLNANFKISDIYSCIKEKFDLIISNPPIHHNLKKSSEFVKEIIYKSHLYLKKKGELRLVINKSYSCEKYFIKNFYKFNILKENNFFKIYQGFIN
ncbi:methyltransferase [Buchnera aphidicola]|uniref:methyltransferase n=1 Tax=Buchnera aphidicola TaxID=9 RepID=UPI0022385836|nr:methyltransferase [Buchnera aphidicola]MCW5197726.1 methyltransferase [Buchnera aphidicola (Chaitophorus viminalis)]